VDAVGISEAQTTLLAKTHTMMASPANRTFLIRDQSELLFLALTVEAAFGDNSNLGRIYWLPCRAIRDDKFDFQVRSPYPIDPLAPIVSEDAKRNHADDKNRD
jgi:hypothetical protein